MNKELDRLSVKEMILTPGEVSGEFIIEFKKAWFDSSNWLGLQLIVSDIPKRLPRKLKKKLFKYTVKLV